MSKHSCSSNIARLGNKPRNTASLEYASRQHVRTSIDVRQIYLGQPIQLLYVKMLDDY